MLNIDVKRQPDIRFQDGALPHAMGVHSFQILRANRAHPEASDNFGWTYNHAPMLAWYHGRYYVEYLSNPVSEHETPGQTLLCTSEDGVNWSFPEVVFPPVEVRLDCYKGPRSDNMPNSILTVPHQRMGFYRGSNDCMLLLSFYGIVHDRRKSAPCDGWGVGRVVRRIYPDGSKGGIFFLMYNEVAGYTRFNTDIYPFYEDSGDSELIQACRELLSDRPVLNQMYEEQRNDKQLFPVPLRQAASFYTIKDGEMITVFKHGVSMRSSDGGRTWSEIVPNLTLKTSTGKVWGQKTDDGRFALMYNPTPDGQHRWPIAIVSGEDGLNFADMRAVTGYMSPQRYGGIDKNLGPQYMRGICERNPKAPDGRIHLVYSNNKEDIWISHLPPQTGLEPEKRISERFDEGGFPARWSVYSPAWAPVRMEGGAMRLSDCDPYDCARVERRVSESVRGRVSLELEVESVSSAYEIALSLHDELEGAPVEIYINARRELRVRAGGRDEKRLEVPFNQKFDIAIDFDCEKGAFTLACMGQTALFAMNTACTRIGRVSLATKSQRNIPYNDIYCNGKYGSNANDLPASGEKTEKTAAALFGFEYSAL